MRSLVKVFIVGAMMLMSIQVVFLVVMYSEFQQKGLSDSINPALPTMNDFMGEKGHQGQLTTKDTADAQKGLVSMRRVCPRTKHLFTSMDAIKTIFLKTEHFHNKGGNLKAIEEYLNSHMDDTLKGLSVQFIPKGSTDPLPEDENIPGFIMKSVKANDKHKRGGYDQRTLPGKYDPVPEIFGGKKKNTNFKIHVVEPTTKAERWKVGMGPIARGLCKDLNRIKSGDKNHHREEKFMCSYNELITNANVQTGHNDREKNDDKCNFVSIGSNGEWGLENAIAEQTKCNTHTFDCTVSDPKKPDVDSIHFYPYCVSHENKMVDGREYLTYATILKKVRISLIFALASATYILFNTCMDPIKRKLTHYDTC